MADRKRILKKVLLVIILCVVIAGGVVAYLLTRTFDDTASIKAAYTTDAAALIKEFITNDTLANKKYTEQIITVNGAINTIEKADTTINIKMADSTGAYIIFAFQQKEASALKALNVGDKVSIKGSCSGGTYSDILETVYIAFKRCSLNK